MAGVATNGYQWHQRQLSCLFVQALNCISTVLCLLQFVALLLLLVFRPADVDALALVIACESTDCRLFDQTVQGEQYTEAILIEITGRGRETRNVSVCARPIDGLGW